MWHYRKWSASDSETKKSDNEFSGGGSAGGTLSIDWGFPVWMLHGAVYALASHHQDKPSVSLS